MLDYFLVAFPPGLLVPAPGLVALYKDPYPYLIERDPDPAPSDPDLYPGIKIQSMK